MQVPFALLATAYRRKRIMEGLISGDREVMAQVCVWGGGLLQHRVLLRTTCMAVKHTILVRHSCGSRLAANGFAVPILDSHLLPVDTANPPGMACLPTWMAYN